MKELKSTLLKKISTVVIFGCVILGIVMAINVFISQSNNIISMEHRSQWYLEKIYEDYPNYYRDVVGNKVVKVAVIDSGIYKEHIDLANCNILSYNVSGIDTENNHDWEHGTMIAGIICGSNSQGNGILGINPNVKLIMIDVSDDSGIKDEQQIIEGIEYAIENDVDIINMSFTTKKDHKELKAAIELAQKQGVVIVASAGNDRDGDITYPASYEGVIAVGAYAKNGDIMYSMLEKCVYLPGENISTVKADDHNIRQYVSRSGTSMATAIYTGILSVIMSRDDTDNIDKLINMKGKIESITQFID